MCLAFRNDGVGGYVGRVRVHMYFKGDARPRIMAVGQMGLWKSRRREWANGRSDGAKPY